MIDMLSVVADATCCCLIPSLIRGQIADLARAVIRVGVSGRYRGRGSRRHYNHGFRPAGHSIGVGLESPVRNRTPMPAIPMQAYRRNVVSQENAPISQPPSVGDERSG